MTKLLPLLIFTLLLCVPGAAQNTNSSAPANGSASAEKPKRQIFRANKDQITQAQAILKKKNLYSGASDGKLNDDMRASLKAWQKDNGLKATGTLNRATLEKMGIELTDRQKEIPVPEGSYDTGSRTAVRGEKDTDEAPARTGSPIFRATRDQIMDAQKVLKSEAMYSGDQTGKLDPDTRAALKKYQGAKGLKVTGTLNQATLEKMGIPLTEKQAAANKD